MKLQWKKLIRIIIIVLCISLCFLGQFYSPFKDLSKDANSLIFIFIGVLILWLTIGIDWPSLLCIFSIGLLDSIGFNETLKIGFGNSTFLFLLFSFVCTYALSKTSFIKRVALFFVKFNFIKKSNFIFTFFFLLSVLFLGLFISPSVLFIIILPILKEIFELCSIEKGSKLGKILMIGLGFSVSISSGMTTISHVFPILAMNAANISISPLLYMGIGIPLGLILFLFMQFIFFISLRKEENKISSININDLRKDISPICKKDVITLVVFIIVLILWILPSIIKEFSLDFYNLINKYGTVMPPLLGTLILCIIKVNDDPIIKIDKAFKEGVPWGSLIMCAATLILGSALTNDSIGLKNYLGNVLLDNIKVFSSIILVIIFISWAVIQTNFSSNMVTATLVATIAASVYSMSSISANFNLNSLICSIGFASALAFATSPSMPHIALVASSGYANSKDIFIYGSIMMIISIIVIVCVGYPLGCLILK